MGFRLLLAGLILISGFQINAQGISGRISDESGKGLDNATISLLKVQDSSVVKFAVSNKEGNYEIKGVDAGKYLVRVSHITHVSTFSEYFEYNGDEKKLTEISLTKAPKQLQEVVITSKKPMVEVKADKTILNVEGTINAVGQDALELLRKSPGVLVDRDDNISLSGKNGVQIYIDGRPSPLSARDLSAFLKTLQSSEIEAIEIIVNPSAKYDAAGNAGIINIRLKKDKTIGTNGSVNSGYSVGIFSKYNEGISLNHRNKKMNAFGTYNFNKSRNQSFMNFDRTLLDSFFHQRSVVNSESESHGYKAGADFFLNRFNTFGVLVNGSSSDNPNGNLSTTEISYKPSGKVNRILIADNSSTATRSNINYNINYRHTDTAGRELNVDADHGRYRMKSDQLQPNYYYNPSGTVLLSSVIYNMIAPTDIDIYTFKTDYEQNYKKGKLGIGGKISFVKSGNDFERFNVFTSSKVLDTLRSNNFLYKENVNALYLNYNKAYKGFMVQAGLRMENTYNEGTSTGYKKNGSTYVPYDSTFTRNYTDLFPSAAITYNKNPMSQWGLSFSRRIDRPAYQDLNPFEFKLDEYTFQKGNTELRPQYTNSIGLTHTFKYKLNTRLNYSHVKDVFTQLIDTAELSKSFITKKNLATQDITSLNISYPLQYKKYNAFFNLNTYYSHYKADFGTGRTIDLDVYAFNIYSQHSVDIGKGWKAELSGWFNSPSIWQGTFETNSMWSVDAGLQKELFKGKGNLKAAVSDIFQTMRWKGSSNFAGQLFVGGGGWESRLFKLNFSYRFGSAQIKAARQRKTGTEEESKRTQTSSGISQ
jgi:iron complex outermembrane recepter protein